MCRQIKEHPVRRQSPIQSDLPKSLGDPAAFRAPLKEEYHHYYQAKWSLPLALKLAHPDQSKRLIHPLLQPSHRPCFQHLHQLTSRPDQPIQSLQDSQFDQTSSPNLPQIEPIPECYPLTNRSIERALQHPNSTNRSPSLQSEKRPALP